VPELARSLELSASTVLRALRGLVEARRVERKGFARATRYQLRAARR
jgi:DNA-binding IclR family transcriptional regulator